MPWTQFCSINEAEFLQTKTKSGVNNVNKDVMITVMKSHGADVVNLINESLQKEIVPKAWKNTVAS